MAHRGGAGLAPENTLEAFRAAVALWSADVLELDVRLSCDGQVVVIHDETVDRTTDGTGAVASMDLKQIRELDAGARFADASGAFPFRGKGVRIPLLEDLLEALPDTRLNIEAKEPRVARPLHELLLRHRAHHRVLFASAEERGRGVKVGWRGATSASRNQLRRSVAAVRAGAGRFYRPATDALQIPAFWEGERVATREFIAWAHRWNLPVHVWTVDDPEEMRRLLEWEVDGIQTDRPDLLARVLHQERGRPLPPGLRPGTG